MKRIYPGYHYSFVIESEQYQGKYSFSINAIHKKSGRYSCINTLNQILSEFEIGNDDVRSGESEWLLTKGELNSFTKIASSLFGKKSVLQFLDSKLDEDRTCGEWENIKSIIIQKS